MLRRYVGLKLSVVLVTLCVLSMFAVGYNLAETTINNDWTLVQIAGNLQINSGTIYLNGWSLTVEGNLTQTADPKPDPDAHWPAALRA
jgi:hypothetical protein